MDQKSTRANDLVIDIENGGVELTKDGALGLRYSERVWDGFPGNVGLGGNGRSLASSCNYPNPAAAYAYVAVEDSNGDSLGGEENVGNSEKQQQKKKNSKKPPKPPRPPKAPSLDEADQKLIREITELAMLRRARIERMKALKKMKNNKATSSNVNIWAFIVTAFFCLVIFWQGFYSKGGANIGFEGSPVSSLANNGGGLISVQYYRNVAEASLSSSASPNVVEQVSGSDSQDGGNVLPRLSR